MARLDWFAFLRQHNIPYTITGPNASPGRVNIRCPFCGDADPSEHLGVSLRGNGYSCWRNQGHRGRDQIRLVAKLLNYSYDDAKALVGGAMGLSTLPSDSEMLEDLRVKLGGPTYEKRSAVKLRMPKEFRSLDTDSRFAYQFLDYLQDRGYNGTQLDWLVDTYDLHYALRRSEVYGDFAYRVIIPIRDRWGELLTWTGRSILPDEELRYKSLRKDLQVCAPKETLLGLPLLWGCTNPKVLLIVEGPFDAFWLTAFGHTFGVYATCLFGLSLQPAQVSLLLDMRSRFQKQVLLLDDDARIQSFRMSTMGVPLLVEKLPSGTKDPATMTPGAVIDLCVKLTS